ncbi:MAG: Hsp20/alpha crystallin family protein [Chloroflexi bacterium]|nr:Hsp20/alpha crystallin family protein [Chloroflexota bacterium]
MSHIVRWEPMRDFFAMREMMDRVFDDLVSQQYGGREAGVPAVDMYQTEDSVVVKATLPGIKPEDLQISITGDVLTIRGESKQEEEVNNAAYHLHERRYGSFSRSIPLPSQVVSDKANAEFEHCILTLTLPKAEEVKPKTITVKAK